MIRISIYKNNKQEYIGFDAEGHAGFQETGQDIVCSAASMLMINTINSVEQFTSDQASVSSEEADARLSYRLKNRPSLEASLLLDSMVLGLEAMEADENYSNYIDLIFEEV